MPRAPTRHGLPPELYREIFSLVHRKSDLCTLCRVSSIVRGVIEPILYHQVELHYGWMPPNTAACKYIAATPHIAKMVRSLSIPTGFGFGFNNMPNYALEALRKMLASLLRAVVNLRALYILKNPFGNTRWSYLQPEIFEGCTFCLSTFHNEPDRGAEKWDSFQLLSQQSNISDWVSASPEETTIVGKKGLLPSLSIVQICNWTSLAALISRPVQRLRLAGSPIAPLNQISNLLRPFGRTLTHLHFQTKGDDLEILREVASAAPHLKFLSYDGDDFSSYRRSDQPTIVEVISQFDKLETLWLRLIMNFIHPSKETPWDDRETVSQERCLLAATQFMAANPNLCRVSFPARLEWVRGRYPCYIRTSPSSAKFEGFGILRDSSWRL